jgi:alpha-tubulin suppressor-like RCC1 family protein
MTVRRATTVACALLACACADETLFVVTVDADPAALEGARSLRLLVCDAMGDEVDSREARIGSEVTLPVEQRIAPRGGDAGRLFSVRAELLDAEGATLGATLAIGGFVEGERIEHELRFDIACTEALACSIGETCRGGVCVSAAAAPLTADDPRLAHVRPCVGSCDGVVCDECEGDYCRDGACRPGRPIVDVSAGMTHTCAVTETQELFCWGTNDWGALGFGTTEPVLVPSQIGGRWIAASVGHTVTCATLAGATDDESTVWCWGANTFGQRGCCGFGETGLLPQATTAPAAAWVENAAGGVFACARTAPGELYCWGHGGDDVESTDDPHLDGSNGLGTGEDTNVPTPIAGTWSHVSAGEDHACAIRADMGDRLFCWGENAFGEIGQGTVGTETNALAPVEVLGERAYRSVSAGERHTCAIDTDGALWCWGNGGGRLGTGSVVSTGLPALAGTSTAWATVTAGGAHTCGTQADGSLWCWGLNDQGQAGSPPSADILAPTRVGDRSDLRRVEAGANHTCAIDASGALYCWGSHDTGALGVPTDADLASPARVCLPAPSM